MSLKKTGQQEGLHDRIVVVDRQRQEFAEKWKNASVMQNTWRLINNSELYDLSKDPGQKSNVIDRYPDKAKELEAGMKPGGTRSNQI